jgi:hypothetical protein
VPPLPKIEFKINLWNKEELISSAMMGPNSLRMEIDHLPVGWRIEVERIAEPEPVTDIVYLDREGAGDVVAGSDLG